LNCACSATLGYLQNKLGSAVTVGQQNTRSR
jgi:hypothetical protein